jgi:hypothetical protein
MVYIPRPVNKAKVNQEARSYSQASPFLTGSTASVPLEGFERWQDAAMVVKSVKEPLVQRS